MKPRKPLPRRTPLAARTGLVRTGGLARRSTALSSTAPIKARRSVGLSVAERAVRDIVIARATGRCEMCWREQGTDFSHRWAEGQSGPYVASNGLWACRLCHGNAHLHPEAAKALGWFVAPVYEVVDGRRVPVAPAEVPARIWTPGGFGPEWVLLDNAGTCTSVGYFELDELLARFGMGRTA